MIDDAIRKSMSKAVKKTDKFATRMSMASERSDKKNQKPKWVEQMTPIILLTGLGVHSIFEGLALGISGDFDKVLLYAIAIVLHKGAAGMSLGISMV